MNRLKHIAWMILLLASCGEAEEVIAPEGFPVEVTREVRISVLPMQSIGTPATRTGEQAEKGEAIHTTYVGEADTRAIDKTTAEGAINNAYILQFGGTATTSLLKKKIPVTVGQLAGTTALTCSFSMTSGVKNRVYVVANCTKTLTEGTTTLGDFEAPVTYTPTAAVPMGGLPLSAFQDVSVDEQFDLFQLRSVLAKLTFTCKTAGATLKLKGLPAGYSFYTRTAGDEAVRPTGMTYNNSSFMMASGSTFYVPENLSGRNHLLIKDYTRALGMAAKDAIYVEITNGSTVYNLLLGDGTTPDFNFAGNYAYNVRVTLYGTDTYDLRIGNPILAAPQDLNGDGATANCYIATSANAWYMFRSDVMGNGAVTPAHAKGLITGDADFPAIVPEPLNTCSADVLWETVNTATAPAKGTVVAGNVYLLKDRILFKSGSVQGNAVIAARDAGNNIIWSWHIWRLSSQPAAIPLAAIGDLTPDGGLILMDRNLGALSAAVSDNLSTGFHYQWGRKDPFPGGANLASMTTGIVTQPANIPIIPEQEKQFSIAQSVAQPTTFCKYSGDWCSTRIDNLWGTPFTTTVSVQNNSYNANQGSKSIYDPCPPGWCVPPGYTFASISESNIVWGSYGANFSGIAKNKQSLWFSAPGSRSRHLGMLNYIGTDGCYWTSSPHADDLTRGNFMYFVVNGVVNPANHFFRGNGYAVRCVKETIVANKPATPIDLSAAGTANCYIVPKAGRYSFNATVMGNGKTVPAHTKGSISGDADFPAITPSALAPASAVVLWETFNTTTAPAKGDVVSDVILEGGKVIFNTGSREGNAVIAVKNSSGTIIWSWHIWRGKQPEEFPFAAIGSLTTDGELVLMDRNLGALSATANDNLSTGLHYQWGRKDPFPAFAGFTSPNNGAIATTPSSMPIVPGSVTQYSIAQSIQQPTTFFKYSGDWCSTRNDNLWGTPLTTSVSINSNNFNSNSGMKSIYDPCPPGWRTPPGYAFANAVTSGIIGNGSWNSNGWNFNIGQSSTISWFPASGSRHGANGSLNSVGSGGYYWTSAPNVDRSAVGSSLYFSSGNVNPVGNSNRTNSFSCRCCRE